ncbi:hypothetical protein [Domibacillus indicus]|uniref:hypothetical protein n=1 Tax=Domibacillus indicus TaxID=1437523 RepID=UPI000617E5D9|nr:hypothetical protein [Domibacillus indicus]
MQKLCNEKGNTLLLVLLVTVIMSTIGLAVVASTIGGANRTTVRVEDVDTTYEAIKAIDSYTAALSEHLRTDSTMYIEKLSKNPNPSFALKGLLESASTVIENKLMENTSIEKIEVTDVTDPSLFTDNRNLTRVLKVRITAIEPGRTAVSRTAEKELIISPLPSFLKYAIGSEKGTLTLNGSPHLQGNIFANDLSISPEAIYLDEKGNEGRSLTPKPSVSGDLYAGTTGSYEEWRNTFEPQKLMDVLKPDNFYKEKRAPGLKNDSQYQSIYFSEAYTEERSAALQKMNAVSAADESSLPKNKAQHMESPPVTGFPDPDDPEDTLTLSEYAAKYDISNINYEGNAVVKPAHSRVENLNVKGSLTIETEGDLTIKNVSVSGGILKIDNKGSGTVTIVDDLISDRGIVIENDSGTIEADSAHIYDELAVEADNRTGSFILGALDSGGDVIFDNESGQIELTEKIQSGFLRTNGTTTPDSQDIVIDNAGSFIVSAPLRSEDDLIIKNKNEMTVDFQYPFSAGQQETSINALYSTGNMNIVSSGSFTLKNHLHALGSITLDFSGKASITGNVVSSESSPESEGKEFSADMNNNITVFVKNNQEGESGESEPISFNGPLFADNKLTIQGDDEQGSKGENDVFSVSGTMYAQGETKISNLSIKGFTPEGEKPGQLVLLSGGSLLITRINEFQNFESSKEQEEGEKPYVPDSEEKIQPLKGFFYTDKEAEVTTSISDKSENPAAKLYGVGSLFYVDGGLFAKGGFAINAIRGETKSFEISTAIPPSEQQEDRYSRFIVDYDRDILLSQLDYLPEVEYLTVYSDQLTVE